jgi:hypothetical protein
MALSGDFKTKSEAMRRLGALEIPPVRIAAILAVPAADVRSALAKERKRESRTAKPRIDMPAENAAQEGLING